MEYIVTFEPKTNGPVDLDQIKKFIIKTDKEIDFNQSIELLPGRDLYSEPKN